MDRRARTLALPGVAFAMALSGCAAPGDGPGDARAVDAAATLDASTFVPEPIPDVDEEPAAPCPETTPPDHFQFLDDTCGAKRHPSYVDRDLRCPIVDTLAPEYLTSAEPISVDSTALVGIVPDALDVTVILIRRVDGAPRYRYLSNGHHDVAFQPWSSSKFLAAANAAASLRIASDYQVGLTAAVGARPLGDLVTSLHNYDDAPYSSNGLGRYFHDIGGRARANDLIHDRWLHRAPTETFGGNYGEVAPPLGYTFVEPGGASVTITPDTSAGPANRLSSLTLAEALKRLVLHREELAQRMPGLQWADLRVLLDGAEGSATYGAWGGMSADTAVYLQAHDMDYVERRSHGRWRIFSKLGLGTGGQFLDVGYACLPVLDDRDQPVPDAGVELVIAAHLPTGGASWAERDRMLARAYRAIVIRAVDGRL